MFSNRDGRAPDRSVPVPRVRAEYDWIHQNYPGYRIIQQRLETHAAPIDVVVLKSPEGDLVTIYFDISAFYGPKEDPTNGAVPVLWEAAANDASETMPLLWKGVARRLTFPALPLP